MGELLSRTWQTWYAPWWCGGWHLLVNKELLKVGSNAFLVMGGLCEPEMDNPVFSGSVEVPGKAGFMFPQVLRGQDVSSCCLTCV